MMLQRAAIVALLLTCLTSFSICQSEPILTSPVDGLQWHNVSNAIERGALCNDFSIAGYFLRKSPNNTREKWVIYLESGGACTTPESCNERYIDQVSRNNYTSEINGTRFVNVEAAWNEYRDRPLEVTSKLMSSLWRFSGHYRCDVSGHWTVEGRGLLSNNREENPDFYNHNHVIIPYCSSDLWLKKTNNFVLANDSDFRFQFDPTAKEHQFTFRGVAILRGVIEDLFNFHGLRRAKEVILAGSSAGGVGAMNHAKWLKEQLRTKTVSKTSLYCLLDSAWFIDFRGNIREQFAPDELQSLVESGEVLESCQNSENDPTICLSAARFLTNQDHSLEGIPTLVLFSRYDLYLLISALQHVDTNVLEIMRVVSEYSGSMNESLMAAVSEKENLSYFVTSCFQHVYLATSNLWGEGRLFGTAAVDGQLENNRFEHTISSDVWTSYHLQHYNSSSVSETITIQEAIHQWLIAAKAGDVVRYQDGCSGPHCNSQCPETISLGEKTPYWDIEAVLLAIVVFISLLSATIKVLLSAKSRYSNFQQKRFLSSNYHDQLDGSESTLPYCNDSEAISIACLNLRYSVTLKNSDLKKAMTPFQRRRLLSIAAALSDPVEVHRGEDGEGSIEEGDVFVRKQLDSETGQTMVTEENDFARSIRQFQELYNQREKQENKRSGLLSGRSHGNQPSKTSAQTCRKKEILKGISTYFNPGELVAIMGPSGCGKTTFLDLLASRRNGRNNYQGELFVNGNPIDKVHDWYVANTGYVLQLATPYYEELTVRENITLAAHMRLPKSITLKEKFERVEQVMRETGLHTLASTVVGGSTGPGLSGGQKRRLCVALQLLNMPSLIFLDEPTSGLDASSSLELLSLLHRVASSNRAVILTIHQPRLEIFHMFDKVILLCQGQVAYHGIPDKAYEVFLEAHQSSSLKKNMESLQSKNPADVIMDMLGSVEARAAILNYYQNSDEPQAVENAIEEVRSVGRDTSTNKQGNQRMFQEAGVINRLSCLEARASKRALLGQILYLPIIFAVYGILLGTVYIQTPSSTLILSGYGVFSCASALFMFPIIYTYLHRAMEIFSLEFADGVGSPIELVLQTFGRFSSLAMLPVLFCSVTLYLLAVQYTQYDIWVFVQITLFSLALNHTWIALLVFVIMAQPGFAHRISPVLSAVAGFSGGFFVPPRLMPPWYSWLFYINPNFYGFSAMARVLLQDIDLGCQYDSPIECYPSSGAYILTYFDLHRTNPYLNVVVLLAMTFVFLLLAWCALTYRHSHLKTQLKKFLSKRKSGYHTKASPPIPTLVSPEVAPRSRHPPLISDNIDESFSSTSPMLIHEDIELQAVNNTARVEGIEIPVDEEFKKVIVTKQSSSSHMRCSSLENLANGRDTQVAGAGGRRFRYRNRHTFSRMLQDGENHQVWKPGASHDQRKQNSPQETLETRRKSIFQRINTYRSGVTENTDQGKQTKPFRKKSILNAPNRDNMQRRMAQWKKIEEEALKLEQQQSRSRSSSNDRGEMSDDLQVVSMISVPPTPNINSSPSSHHEQTRAISNNRQLQVLTHSNNNPPSSGHLLSSYNMNVNSARFMSSRSLPCVYGQAGNTPPSIIPSTISLHRIEQVLQHSSQSIKSTVDSPMSANLQSRPSFPNFRHFADHASLTNSTSYGSNTSTSTHSFQNSQSVIAMRSRKPIVSPSFSNTLPQGQYFIFPDVPSSTVELSHSLASTSYSSVSPDSSGNVAYSLSPNLTHILDMPSNTRLLTNFPPKTTSGNHNTSNDFPPKTATGHDSTTAENANIHKPCSPSVRLSPSISNGTLTPGFQLVNLKTLPPSEISFSGPPPLQLQSVNDGTSGRGHPGSPQVHTFPTREKQLSMMDSIFEEDSEVSSSVDITSETSLYRTTSANVELMKDEGEVDTDTSIIGSSPSGNPVVRGVEVKSIDSKTRIYESNPPLAHRIILTKESDDDGDIDELESCSVTEIFLDNGNNSRLQVQNEDFTTGVKDCPSSRRRSATNSSLTDFETRERDGFASKTRQKDKVQTLQFPCTLEEMRRVYQTHQQPSHEASSGRQSTTSFSDGIHKQPGERKLDSLALPRTRNNSSSQLSREDPTQDVPDCSSASSSSFVLAKRKHETVTSKPSAQRSKFSMPLALSINLPYKDERFSDSDIIDSDYSSVKSTKCELLQPKKSSTSDPKMEVWTSQITNLKPIPVLNSPLNLTPSSESSLLKLSSPRLSPASHKQSTTKANGNNDCWNEVNTRVSQSPKMASGCQQSYVVKSPTTVAKPNIQNGIHGRIHVRPHTGYQQTDI